MIDFDAKGQPHTTPIVNLADIVPAIINGSKRTGRSSTGRTKRVSGAERSVIHRPNGAARKSIELCSA